MEKEKVDMYIGMHCEYFNTQDLMVLKERLEKIDDSKLFILQSLELQKPSMILLIAIFLGWERFWLDDIALGIVKIITGYGCGIWWLIDIFTAKDRAKRYNFVKLSNAISLI